MHILKKIALIASLPFLANTFVFAQSENTASKSATMRTPQPIPKEKLKDLTITFDNQGNPIFTLKKNLKPIQCAPSSASAEKGRHGALPRCNAADRKPTTSESIVKQTPSKESQLSDTVCYTVYWEDGGVVYSYTFCYDTSGANQ